MMVISVAARRAVPRLSPSHRWVLRVSFASCLPPGSVQAASQTFRSATTTEAAGAAAGRDCGGGRVGRDSGGGGVSGRLRDLMELSAPVHPSPSLALSSPSSSSSASAASAAAASSSAAAASTSACTSALLLSISLARMPTVFGRWLHEHTIGPHIGGAGAVQVVGGQPSGSSSTERMSDLLAADRSGCVVHDAASQRAHARACMRVELGRTVRERTWTGCLVVLGSVVPHKKSSEVCFNVLPKLLFLWLSSFVAWRGMAGA